VQHTHYKCTAQTFSTLTGTMESRIYQDFCVCRARSVTLLQTASGCLYKEAYFMHHSYQ
jgi:hypothetical protein